MDIRFICHHCSQPIRIDEAAAGMQINCPGCRALLTIPAASPAAQPVAAAPMAPRSAVAPPAQVGGPMQPVKPGARALPRLRPEPTSPSSEQAPPPEVAAPMEALGKASKPSKGAQFQCMNPNCKAVLTASQVVTQMVAGKISKVCSKCRGNVIEMAPPPSIWKRMMGKK